MSSPYAAGHSGAHRSSTGSIRSGAAARRRKNRCDRTGSAPLLRSQSFEAGNEHHHAHDEPAGARLSSPRALAAVGCPSNQSPGAGCDTARRRRCRPVHQHLAAHERLGRAQWRGPCHDPLGPGWRRAGHAGAGRRWDLHPGWSRDCESHRHPGPGHRRLVGTRRGHHRSWWLRWRLRPGDPGQRRPRRRRFLHDGGRPARELRGALERCGVGRHGLGRAGVRLRPHRAPWRRRGCRRGVQHRRQHRALERHVVVATGSRDRWPRLFARHVPERRPGGWRQFLQRGRHQREPRRALERCRVVRPRLGHEPQSDVAASARERRSRRGRGVHQFWRRGCGPDRAMERVVVVDIRRGSESWSL